MRKFLLLFFALLTSVSGAWADETVTVTSESALWDANGSWTASYGTWGTTWKSTNGKVCVTSQTAGYLCKTASQIATTNVTIWTPDDDVMITGYSIKFKSNAAGNSYIEGATEGVTSTGTSDEKTFSVTGLYSHNAVFKVQTNYANIIDFTITYTTLPAQTAEGYYIIKNTWSGNRYLLAQPASNAAKVYKKSTTTSELITNNNYVWKVTSYGDYKVIQNVGTERYISNFNTANTTSAAKDGSEVNLLNATEISDAEVFTFTDRSSSEAGAVAFRGNSKNKDCWLNCYNQTDGAAVGFYKEKHDGDYMLLTRVYKVTFNKDTGTELKKLFKGESAITAADLEDCYDYSIGGVAKTKDEVVTAINAVTDDNLVVVCSYKRSATISSKAEIDPTKVYSLTTARGWLYAKDASNTVKTYPSTATFNTFNEDNQWAFVTVDDGDTYYLYNVGKKRFLMSRMGGSNFMDSKFTIRPVTINTTGDATYPISFKDETNTYNVSGGDLLIDSWSTADEGNQYSVQPIANIEFNPSEAQAAINAMSSNIPFHTSPAPSAGSFDEATTWYNISMRPGDGDGGFYAYYPDGYSETNNIPLNSTKGSKDENDKYRWCITGSVENGYRLYNKAAGADKVFVFDGGGKMKAYTGNETASLFYLASANITNGIGAPTFVFKNTDSRPNKQGDPPVINTWSNSDIGSEFCFVIDEAYDANNFYYIEYVQTVKPFMDDALSSQYFHLTSAEQKENIWNAPTRYSDGVEHAFYSHDDVTAMRTAVEAYLKKPVGTMAVRLKNTNLSKYVSYGTPTWNEAGLICDETFAIAEADLTSVLQFIPIDATTYYIYMPTMGKYVGSQTSGNTAFPLVEEASRAVFTIAPTNTPGVISIYNTASAVDANFQGYLHAAGWSKPGVVNWQASNASSYWIIEDAGTICFDMIEPEGVSDGNDVYMTYVNLLGLPVKAPEGASVYKVATQDLEKAVASTVDSKEIPTGSGVIIKAEKGSTVHMSIKTSTTETLASNILVAGDGSTKVAEGNFMLAYKSTDDVAKFYAIGSGGYVVPANKAYLPAMGVGAKELTLFFGDDVDGINAVNDEGLKVKDSIYNLAGQRVQKAQKGLYIVNGKKVVIK